MGRVLLIDHHVKVLRMWADALRSAGIDHVTALQEDEAEQHLRALPIAVVVCGHHPPRIDAGSIFRLARCLRPLVRGLLCTARIDEADTLCLAQAGFDDAVFLPWREAREFTASVRSSLRRAATWRLRLEEFNRPGGPMYWQSMGFEPQEAAILAGGGRAPERGLAGP